MQLSFSLLLWCSFISPAVGSRAFSLLLWCSFIFSCCGQLRLWVTFYGHWHAPECILPIFAFCYWCILLLASCITCILSYTMQCYCCCNLTFFFISFFHYFFLLWMSRSIISLGQPNMEILRLLETEIEPCRERSYISHVSVSPAFSFTPEILKSILDSQAQSTANALAHQTQSNTEAMEHLLSKLPLRLHPLLHLA